MLYQKLPFLRLSPSLSFHVFVRALFLSKLFLAQFPLSWFTVLISLTLSLSGLSLSLPLFCPCPWPLRCQLVSLSLSLPLSLFLSLFFSLFSYILLRVEEEIMSRSLASSLRQRRANTCIA